MTNSNQKGDRRERELTNLLDGDGFAVMRAPSSGSATPRDLPDLLAGDGDRFWALECKASAGPPIYIGGEEVDSLEFFASNFGAEALLAVRFDYDDWHFIRPQDCHQTDGGNYRVKQEAAWNEGRAYSEVVG